MNWANIGKWLGVVVAILPQIIQIIGTLTNNGVPPMPQDVANGASLLGGGIFSAGVGKVQSDNVKRIKLGLASEPNPIPVEKQDAAIEKMEEKAKTAGVA